jgi:hypothetical protein
LPAPSTMVPKVVTNERLGRWVGIFKLGTSNTSHWYLVMMKT